MIGKHTLCNCPAGFSADPERHAPDCPGRSGAGKSGGISHERFQELMGNITGAAKGDVPRYYGATGDLMVKAKDYDALQQQNEALKNKCEQMTALAEIVQSSRDRAERIANTTIEALRAELEAVRNQQAERQEPVGEMRESREPGVAPFADIWSWLEPGTKLYTATQPAKDVVGLVKALETIDRHNDNPARFDVHIDTVIRAALAVYRAKEEGHE